MLAFSLQPITGTQVTLFQAKSVGGTEPNNVLAYAITNQGNNTVYIWSRGHHGDTVPANPDPATASSGWLPLAAGKSVTLDIKQGDNNNTSILHIVAVCPSSSTTVGGGVVSRGG